MRLGGKTGLLSSRIAAHHPDFQEGEVCLCVGAQPGLPWARDTGLCGPHLWQGVGATITCPTAWVEAAGVEIQLREVGGQPGMARKTWASRRM